MYGFGQMEKNYRAKWFTFIVEFVNEKGYYKLFLITFQSLCIELKSQKKEEKTGLKL